MLNILPHGALLLAFLSASLILAVTPDPGVLYIVTCSASSGRQLGLASVAGVDCGNLGNATAASFGLAALFAVSSIAFSVAKLCGAGYLIFLGVKALTSAPSEANDDRVPGRKSAFAILRQGFLVALLNPKTTIFYAAFLPQFVGSGGSALSQTLILSVVFVAIAASTDSLYALTAGNLGSKLAKNRFLARRWRWTNGAVLIMLGVVAALSPQPALRKG